MTTLYAKSYKSEDGDRAIRVIRLVGTSDTATTADARVLHYRFYCELDTSEPRAVSIDMTPGADGRTGVLYIAGVGRVNTESALPVWIAFEVVPMKPITVAELVQFYKTKGLDRFRFNEEGAGCRSLKESSSRVGKRGLRAYGHRSTSCPVVG